VSYREVLRVPIWWIVIGLGVALLAAAEISQPTSAVAVIPWIVLPGLTLAGLVTLSRKRVLVQDGVLHVAGARAPLTAFGPAEVLARDDLRVWRGPRADRSAWVAVRPWIKGAVRLPVIDPDDETPYWLIGTRDPVGLAVALTPLPEGL
jgi:hypothetical protein